MEIKQLILQTSALLKLEEFYTELMELPAKRIAETRIVIEIGSTKLEFQQVSNADPFYHLAINIPANKIKEAKKWMRSRVELLWLEDYKSYIADFTNWNARSVYFFDPAGNILELITRFDLANKTDAIFSSAYFLSVSEAGLVFKEDELNDKAENLLQQYSLTYFEKQKPLPHFKAIGDDKGLFIVVPENRNWYPTNKLSGIFPMEIVFENEGRIWKLKI